VILLKKFLGIIAHLVQHLMALAVSAPICMRSFSVDSINKKIKAHPLWGCWDLGFAMAPYHWRWVAFKNGKT